MLFGQRNLHLHGIEIYRDPCSILSVYIQYVLLYLLFLTYNIITVSRINISWAFRTSIF